MEDSHPDDQQDNEKFHHSQTQPLAPAGNTIDIEQKAGNPVSSATAPAPRTSHKRLYIILAILSVAAVAVAVSISIYLLLQSKDNRDNPKSSAIQSETSLNANEDYGVLNSFARPKTGEVWYDQPRPIPAQGWIAATTTDFAEYFEVGTRGTNTIIVAHIGKNKSDGSKSYFNSQLFEKSQNGSVTHIGSPGGYAQYIQSRYIMPDVPLNDKQIYDSVALPGEFTINGVPGTFQFNNNDPHLGNVTMFKTITKNAYTNRKELKKLGSSTLVRYEKICGNLGVTSYIYAIDLPFGSSYNLSRSGETPSVAYWACEGDQELSLYMGKNNTLYKIDNASEAMFTKKGAPPKMGTTPVIDQAYGFNDINNPIVKKAYDTYVGAQELYIRQYASRGGNVNGPQAPKVESIQTFVDKDSVYAGKSAQGEWLLYSIYLTL